MSTVPYLHLSLEFNSKITIASLIFSIILRHVVFFSFVIPEVSTMLHLLVWLYFANKPPLSLLDLDTKWFYGGLIEVLLWRPTRSASMEAYQKCFCEGILEVLLWRHTRNASMEAYQKWFYGGILEVVLQSHTRAVPLYSQQF